MKTAGAQIAFRLDLHGVGTCFQRLQDTSVVGRSSNRGWDVCASLDHMPTRHTVAVVGADHPPIHVGHTHTHKTHIHTHTHTQDTHTHKQQSTVTTTTSATKSGGGQQRKAEEKKASTQRHTAINRDDGNDSNSNSACLFSESVGGQKRARPVESSRECTEELLAHTHTQAQADWRPTLMTRDTDPTVVRVSHGAIATNTSSSNNSHSLMSAENAQL